MMSSKAIFIRHAIPLSNGYASDDLRPLSEEGKAVQRLSAAKLLKMGITPTLIYCSPLVRALQTAEILAEVLGGSVEIEPALGIEFSSQALLEKLPDPKSGEVRLYVGHAPNLALFVNQLVGEEALPRGLSKSAAAIIEIREEGSRFIELIAP